MGGSSTRVGVWKIPKAGWGLENPKNGSGIKKVGCLENVLRGGNKLGVSRTFFWGDGGLESELRVSK